MSILLETAEGDPDKVKAGELAETLGEALPRLLFLSACKEIGEHEDKKGIIKQRFAELVQKYRLTGRQESVMWYAKDNLISVFIV